MSRKDLSKKNLSKLTAGSLVLTGFLLAGCSSSGYYYDRKTEYVDAKEYPAVHLPESADERQFRQAMPLPDIASRDAYEENFVVPRPDALPVVDEDLPPAELKEYAGAEGIAPRIWLSLSNAPAVAWPLLQRRFEQLGWPLRTADPSSGRLSFVPDTQVSAEPVRARLRQGIRGGFSDLELIGREGTVRTDSAAKSLLSQIGSDLDTVSTGAQSVSLLAQNISREKTVRLQAPLGEDPVLILGTDADRTWIGLQDLLSAQFTDNEQQLLASDAKARQFTIVWVPEDERSGFLTRWASDPGTEFQYQLVLSGSGPVQIQVRQQGAAVDPRKARQILSGIRELLS